MELKENNKKERFSGACKIIEENIKLIIKEALHIRWENLLLNKQVNHGNLTLSF